MLNLKFCEKIKQIEIKRLWKYFVLLFFLSFLFINWQELSLATNYRIIGHKISSLFGGDSGAIREAEILDGNKDKEKSVRSGHQETRNWLEIPDIGVSAPIVFAETDDEKEFERSLDRGVLVYPGYSRPGEEGTVVILGHSAPEGWPKIDYDNVFSNLNQLQKGARIFVHYNNQEYVYQVIKQFVFFPEDEDKFIPQTNQKNSLLILLTCWPKGKDFKRLGILAELIEI